MKVLAVDIGGNNVKILATGQTVPRKFPSGPTLTPRRMVTAVEKLAADWKYDVVSIGYPGQVIEDRAVTEPCNLAHGWVGFDFAKAFGRPVKLINDAAMQALGSYNGGTMLFLGLGTGLGSALIVRGHIVPMEVGALSWANGTIEDYVGNRGLRKLGKKKWRKTFNRLVARLVSGFLLDDTVIGGGNAKKLKAAPPGCRLGSNANAFIGGYRMWQPTKAPHTATAPERSPHDPGKKRKGART
jgi:polyphosphate glucokinase